MTRSEMRQTFITIICCLATAGVVLFINRTNHKKIAVVDAVKLFNDYRMKSELEAGSAGNLQLLAGRADSLKKELSLRSRVKEIAPAEMQQLYQAANQAQMEWEQSYRESNQNINEQVWKRLNPLIDEFGRQNKLRLMIGANGMGSVLYNDDFYDRTKELIDFVNKEYEKGK